MGLETELKKYGIGIFYRKVRYLTDEGLYGAYILEHYSQQEVDALAELLDDSRNKLLNYSGLNMLLNRYVIRNRAHAMLETPQEMFLGIAMHLAMLEKTDRLGWTNEFYDKLRLLKVTVATQTLSNARKPHHQLSSCFTDTVPDILLGISRCIDDVAQVSKYGGGRGLCFGKVRATGSNICGFRGQWAA